MRKWIGRIFGLVIVLILMPSALILTAFPAEWHQSHSVEVDANYEIVHEWVRDLALWEKWNSFADHVPNTEIKTYGSTRRNGDSISFLRPLTAAFIANPKDPAAIEAEMKARQTWNDSQSERYETVQNSRREATVLLEDAGKLRSEAMSFVNANREQAEKILRYAPVDEYVEFLPTAIKTLDANSSHADWVSRISDRAKSALNEKTPQELADTIRELQDQLRREGGALPAWGATLLSDINKLVYGVGNGDSVRLIRDISTLGPEHKKNAGSRAISARLRELAGASKYGTVMKEAAKLLDDAVERNEKDTATVREKRGAAKALEDKADAIDKVRRKDWSDREIGSAILMITQKRQVSPEAQKLMVALEKTNILKLTRTQYLRAIADAGISEKDADNARVELREVGFLNVVPRPDLFRVIPEKSMPKANQDDITLLVQIGNGWKHLYQPNWESFSETLLSKTEAEQGIKELLDSGLVILDSFKKEYSFADMREFNDEKTAPQLTPVGIKALVTMLAVESKTQPVAKFKEIIAPRLGKERMEAAFQRIVDSGVFRIEIGDREETTEIARREGTTFRFTFGEGSRMQTDFQITYRAISEEKTLVTWRGTGRYRANPIHRIAGYFNNDSVGEVMKRGLQNLKKVAEAGHPNPEEE